MIIVESNSSMESMAIMGLLYVAWPPAAATASTWQGVAQS